MKTHLINSSLLLASLLISLLALEWLIAPWFLALTNNPPRQQTLINFTALPGDNIDGVSINTHGFTGDLLLKQKPNNTLQILTLGGSVMFNNHINQNIKQHLQTLTDKTLLLEGAGLRSHSSASSLIKYQQFFSAYAIDYVFIYHGINDLWMNHVPADIYQSDYSHYLPGYKRNWLLNNSVTARLLYNHIAGGAVPYKHNGANFDATNSFRNNMEQLIQSIQASGAKPVLMTFAWLIPPNYSQTLFEQTGAGYQHQAGHAKQQDFWPVEIWGEVDYVKTALNQHNRIIRELAQQYQLDLIDQEKLLGNNIDNFGDICHFSPQGQQRFIGNIADYLTAKDPAFQKHVGDFRISPEL